MDKYKRYSINSNNIISNIGYLSFFISCLGVINIFFRDSLEKILIAYIMIFIGYTFHCYNRLKSIKQMVTAVDYFLIAIFVPYSIIAPSIFIIEKYIPRINIINIDYVIMSNTLLLYYNILCITIILLILFSNLKTLNIYNATQKMGSYISRKLINSLSIWDFIALICALLLLWRFAMVYDSYFSMSTLQKRAALSTSYSHYSNLYMVVYCAIYFIGYMFSRRKRLLVPRAMTIIIYWCIYAFSERRMLIRLIFTIVILFCGKIKKVKPSYIITFGFVIGIFLTQAARRAGLSIKTSDIGDFIYMSTTEFNCTFFVSNYYVGTKDFNMYFGKTYIIDSLTYLLPSFIYPNKTIGLSTMFKQLVGLKVAFSFNPVAEGLINFGSAAVITVPNLFFLLIKIIKWIYKKNVIIYALIVASLIDFHRGAFSNFFFDSIFIIVIVFCMTYINSKIINIKHERSDLNG